MAKGIGLIGNFKGKVGNTVGYKLTASNNGQTQGIRVYQPIVKNPKSAGQAEQRAKLLAVNATYRALKIVIDRGNEGLPYGNKSRLAWLKTALKAQQMPWYEKGATVFMPVGCKLSKGSLAGLAYNSTDDGLEITCGKVTAETPVATVANITSALMAGYPHLKEGDQVTFIQVGSESSGIGTTVLSIVLNTKSAEAVSGFTANNGKLRFDAGYVVGGAAVIVSREGDNGEHLRSTSQLIIADSNLAEDPYDADSKAAAIASYRASAASNSDWAEESIQ